MDPSLTFHALINPESVDESTRIIVWDYRIPRTLAAVLVGILMAIAGLLMQASTLNPLADPYLTGAASGAIFGVSLALFMITFVDPSLLAYLGQYFIVIPAFLGSIATLFLVLAIAGAYKFDPITLVLGGVAISMLFGALSLIIQTMLGERILNVIIWSLGTLSFASWPRDSTLLTATLMSFPITLLLYKHLNAIMLGDEAAQSLGVNPRRIRFIALVISSLTTATVVSMMGIIGFLGLIAPHLARFSLRSNDHLLVIPIACMLGALLALFGDIMARSIITPGELPLTPIMSLIGVPLLVYLMRRRGRSYGD